MALLHEEKHEDLTYQVRTAGNTRRLYTNGVFHTQHNPDHLFSNAVWDMLSVPALFAKHTPLSVLMLGVGGGSAIHQLQKLMTPAEIVGIDINQVHLKLAEKYFDLHYQNLKLMHADGIAYVRRCKRKFDLVVDDIFVEASNPVRPMAMDQNWLGQTIRLVSNSGVLIQNHISTRSINTMLKEQQGLLRAEFSSLLIFRAATCENAVLVAYRDQASVSQRKGIHQILKQRFGSQVNRLHYSIRTVF